MATKTFKIGEYAKGGVITAEVNGKTITVIGKEWDYSQGTRKSSNQSKAKEFIRREFNAESSECRWNLESFLNELTTSYYTSTIMEWIETKVKIGKYW